MAGSQEPNADALIVRARGALGGRALGDVIALVIDASVSLEFGGTTPSVSRAVEVSYLAPEKFLRVNRYRPTWPVELELTYYDGFNGATPIEELVASIPQFPIFVDGPRALESARDYRARLLLEQRDEFIQTMLPLFITLPGHFGLVFRAGNQTTYAGGTAHGLQVLGPGDRRWELLLDMKSGLPVQLSWKGRPLATRLLPSVAKRLELGGIVPTSPPPIVFPVEPPVSSADVEWVMTIRDFRLTNGVNWPRRFVTTVDGRRHMDFRVARYQINPRIDPKVFDRPAAR